VTGISQAAQTAGLLWTFEGLKLTSTKFIPGGEGEFHLTFEDGRTMVFTAVGDDMTYCLFEVTRD
jgi:hypothetical protein